MDKNPVTLYEAIRNLLPPSYYAGLDLMERIRFLVADWQHAIEVNKKLEAERDHWYEEAMSWSEGKAEGPKEEA